MKNKKIITLFMLVDNHCLAGRSLYNENKDKYEDTDVVVVVINVYETEGSDFTMVHQSLQNATEEQWLNYNH
jgi:hypothetical protein